MNTNLALLRKARDHLAMDSRRRDMAKAVEAATDLLIKLAGPSSDTSGGYGLRNVQDAADKFLKAR